LGLYAGFGGREVGVVFFGFLLCSFVGWFSLSWLVGVVCFFCQVVVVFGGCKRISFFWERQTRLVAIVSCWFWNGVGLRWFYSWGVLGFLCYLGGRGLLSLGFRGWGLGLVFKACWWGTIGFWGCGIG